MSARTDPSERVHPGAIAAAKPWGLDLASQPPQHLDAVKRSPRLVITVCDRAHQELEPVPQRLHRSVTDPVPVGDKAAFDTARDELEQRLRLLVTVSVVCSSPSCVLWSTDPVRAVSVVRCSSTPRIHRLMREAGQLQAQFEGCGDLSSGDL